MPTLDARRHLRRFVEEVYFHQVVQKNPDGSLTRYKDLDVALDAAAVDSPPPGTEWRVHFHVPLHCPPGGLYQSTSDHISGLLEIIRSNPRICSHFEMETYTWEVLPPEMKNRSVVEQLCGEYAWTLEQMRSRGLC